MLIKDINECDFINYKKISMFIIFPFCSFKCDKEFGVKLCQNWGLTREPNIEISSKEIIDRYLRNPITQAVVCGGLEPFDSWKDLLSFIKEFRKFSNDDIVIYTGYNKDEILDKIQTLKDNNINNIIIKFGRYKPNEEKHFDEVLGVNLASFNQYAERVS